MFTRFPKIPPGTVRQRTACLYGLQSYLQGIVSRAAACFLNYLKMTPGDYRPRITNAIYRGMLVQGAACLYGFKTYLKGTVSWEYSQFIRFLNLLNNVSYSKSCLDFCHL